MLLQDVTNSAKSEFLDFKRSKLMNCLTKMDSHLIRHYQLNSPQLNSPQKLRCKIITQNYYLRSWTSPGSNTPQDTNCTATCPLSRKLFKLGEPDMQDIAGEAVMNS